MHFTKKWREMRGDKVIAEIIKLLLALAILIIDYKIDQS